VTDGTGKSSDSDGVEVMSDDSSFHRLASETGNARSDDSETKRR